VLSPQPCRFCGAPITQTLVDLGASPLSNAFLSESQLNDMEPFYPLKAGLCGECCLVQLPAVRTPDQIFDEYAYFSSYSESWLAHASRYVDAVMERFHLGPESQVVEIASNDGYLLQYFAARGVPVLGIEPAANVAAVAEEKGIPTVVRFFGVETAGDLVAQGRPADLLVGNNVLAHVPDLNDFVAGLKILLSRNGVLTMEFPHLLRMMEDNQFDTIYHEHFSYFSFLTARRVFERHGIRLFDVEKLPTHGGSLRIYGCHEESAAHPVSPRVCALLAEERDAGLDRPETYSAFGKRVHETKRALLDFLIGAKASGKRIVGYGAPAKGNTLLNFCGIRTDFLEYTVDLSPHKQGKYLPGTRIPIYAPSAIRETRPDYLLILPWNLKSEIMSQMSHIREWDGKFVVPIPSVEVLD
jgi:hypothetical protein